MLKSTSFIRFIFFCGIVFFCCLLPSTVISHEEPTPNCTLMVQMRDGTQLPTDIYLPTDLSQKYPLILIRNPSGRKAYPWVKYAELVQAGYIIAFQDTRSAMDLEGKTMPFLADGWGEMQDGYDAIEALAKYKHCNGKVGTAGFSAPGITQHMLAPTAPPSLCAQHIGVAASSIYHDAIYTGGALQKNQVEGWLKAYAKHPGVYQHVLEQSLYNSFWSNFNTLEQAHKVQVPALMYTGWYDTFLQGALDAFIARHERGGEGAKGKQKLVIGPWTHYWPQDTRLGDFQVPQAGQAAPWDISPITWFAHYLKGLPVEIDQIPAVTYYVMGPFDGEASSGNRWKAASSWPVPCSYVPYYLSSDKTLVKSCPEQESTMTYAIDLENPVSTEGGCNLFLQSGPKDQRAIEAHKDVLVFTSAELKEDLEVVGRLKANVYYYLPDHEADIVVRLTDVYPDGKSVLIADGIYHLHKYLPGLQTHSSLTPCARLAEVDLWSTAIVFAKGHRLRVSISGTNYPKYEKPKLGQDEQNKSYGVTFLQGGATASHLLLPVVKSP